MLGQMDQAADNAHALHMLIVMATTNVVLGVVKLCVMATILYLMVKNRRRFDKHLCHVELKTDEYLTIMKRVGALVTGRMGQAQRDLERTGERIESKLAEKAQDIQKEVIQTVAVTDRFPKRDTDKSGPETEKIEKGYEK